MNELAVSSCCQLQHTDYSLDAYSPSWSRYRHPTAPTTCSYSTSFDEHIPEIVVLRVGPRRNAFPMRNKKSLKLLAA